MATTCQFSALQLVCDSVLVDDQTAVASVSRSTCACLRVVTTFGAGYVPETILSYLLTLENHNYSKHLPTGTVSILATERHFVAHIGHIGSARS